MKPRFTWILTVTALIGCSSGSDGNGDGRAVPLLERVEGIMSGESLLGELEGLTAIGHRMSGTPNEIEARDHVAARFSALGLENVHTEIFPYLLWERGTCGLEAIEPEAVVFEARALGFSPDTPEDGLDEEVVFVGAGMPEDYEALAPEDYEGKILLVTGSDEDITHRTIQYILAQLHGAAGFIHMTHMVGEAGESLIEIGSTQYLAAVPAVAIDRDSGLRLRAWIEEGERPRVRMDVDADRHIDLSWNVVGEIPGSIRERVTIGAHYDSWDVGPCAIDNASGVAAILEMARVMVALGPHQRTIRFVAFGAEELGIQGSIAYGLRHGSDIREHCKLMVNIDMIGTFHGYLSVTAVPQSLKCLAGGLLDEIGYTERTGYDGGIAEVPALGTDCTPFVLLGIPTLSTGKYPFIYYHTEYDTIDKVDPNDLYVSTLFNLMVALEYADPLAIWWE